MQTVHKVCQQTETVCAKQFFLLDCKNARKVAAAAVDAGKRVILLLFYCCIINVYGAAPSHCPSENLN